MNNSTDVKVIDVGLYTPNIIGFLAQIYGDALSVIRECVQNSLDQRPKHIFVEIDQIRRNITVYDDGLGASFEEISQKFKQVGRSLKIGDPEAIGEKGIGNLAGLAIAQEWRLVTKDTQNPADWFRLYSLNRSALTSGSEKVPLHSERWPGKVITNTLQFNPSAMVQLLDVSEAAFRQLKNIEQLEESLLEAFGRLISSRKVELRISFRNNRNKRHDKIVKPAQFRGAKLDPERYDTPFGYVEFELYCSQTPLDNPKILVQHRGVYTLSIFVLFKLKQLPAEIEEIFSRGYFEGIIRLPFCTINPGRTGFELNEQLTCFADTVRTFALEVLKPIIDNLEEEGRLDKYRRVGELVLKRLARFFKVNPDIIPPKLKSFTEAIKGVMAEPQQSEVKIPLPRRQIPKTLLSQQRKEANEKAKSPKSASPKREEPKTVESRAGIALQFVLPRGEEEFNWHSRLTPEGVIQINAGNTDFRKAEMLGITKLDDYVFILVLKEFTCASIGPIEGKTFNDAFERFFMKFWRVNLNK
jgi:hypothetical protein